MSSLRPFTNCPPVKKLRPSDDKSRPIAVPRIGLNNVNSVDGVGSDDDVFDGVDKENNGLNPARVLFPSVGTSPRNGFSLDSPRKCDLRKICLDADNVKTLGKGAFGTVILGILKGRRVAVKSIFRRDSLENEKNLKVLDHENVVRIHDIIEFHDKDAKPAAVLVLEYVGQYNMQAIIEQKSQNMSAHFIHSSLFQVALGLEHCHNKRIVHLDVKPANVLVTSTGRCKLADFGCSQRIDAITSCRFDLVGTPGYQAPEMLRRPREGVGPGCDTFAFAISMWQIINFEHRPYPHLHPHAIIYQVVYNGLRPLTKKEPNLLPHHTRYERLYQDCWNADPAVRPKMKMVAQLLARLGKKSSNEFDQEKRPNKARRKSSCLRI